MIENVGHSLLRFQPLQLLLMLAGQAHVISNRCLLTNTQEPKALNHPGLHWKHWGSNKSYTCNVLLPAQYPRVRIWSSRLRLWQFAGHNPKHTGCSHSCIGFPIQLLEKPGGFQIIGNVIFQGSNVLMNHWCLADLWYPSFLVLGWRFLWISSIQSCPICHGNDLDGGQL